MNTKFAEAYSYYKNGQIKMAKKLCQKIKKKDPNNYENLNLLSIILFQKKIYDQSIYLIKKSLKINPNQAETNNNLGIMLIKLKKLREAKFFIKQSIKIKPDFIEPYNNLGIVYKELNEYKKALDIWKKAIKINKDDSQLFNNIGNILVEIKKEKEALEYYKKAIKVDEKFFLAYFNLGNALQKLNLFEDSIHNYKKVFYLKEDYAEAYYNCGNSYLSLNKLDKALEYYKKAYKIDPNLNELYGNILNLNKTLCKWENYEKEISFLEENISLNKNLINPFTALSIFNSSKVQNIITNENLKEKYQKNQIKDKKEIFKRKNNIKKKIKIGYYSSDFKQHAMSNLIAGMLEAHDKNKFEIIGFSLTQSKSDKMRSRIINAFDKFLDVSSHTDYEISEISKKLEIDIAVDLMGFTKLNRFGIFLKGCAPIQINYLGYPGTLGSDNIDYIIADKILIPQENTKYYNENIIYLPNSYQANDSKRKISEKNFTREKFNLPDNSFVFCCFNKKYKFDPKTFSLWMKILDETKNSVLWLLNDNNDSTKNLINEAKLRGIDTKRIIFSEKLPMEEHLARHKLADIFLDTFPYGAHTTCSDALWTGLPVITKIGNTFASRVSSSLLNNLDLNELITENDNQYVNLAIQLASNKQKYNLIKEKLKINIQKKPLFDTLNFTKNIEKAYIVAFNRFLQNLPTTNIII